MKERIFISLYFLVRERERARTEKKYMMSIFRVYYIVCTNIYTHEE